MCHGLAGGSVQFSLGHVRETKMKDYYIRCFVEGCKEGARLHYDIVRNLLVCVWNLLISVPMTGYEFIRRDRPYLRDLPPPDQKPDECANLGVGADRPAASESALAGREATLRVMTANIC